MFTSCNSIWLLWIRFVNFPKSFKSSSLSFTSLSTTLASWLVQNHKRKMALKCTWARTISVTSYLRIYYLISSKPELRVAILSSLVTVNSFHPGKFNQIHQWLKIIMISIKYFVSGAVHSELQRHVNIIIRYVHMEVVSMSTLSLNDN
jgi:hypothetical protein